MEVTGLTVNYFKRSGKWYMEETLDVPKGLSSYETRIWISENRPYKDEFHMVISDDYADDIIGFPMMDLAR